MSDAGTYTRQKEDIIHEIYREMTIDTMFPIVVIKARMPYRDCSVDLRLQEMILGQIILRGN